jgi:hypothetical protein
MLCSICSWVDIFLGRILYQTKTRITKITEKDNSSRKYSVNNIRTDTIEKMRQ